jgi:hypothetical protein
MKLHFLLALALLSSIALLSSVVTAQSLDHTMDDPAKSEASALPATEAPGPSETPPPDTSETVPISSFEAIQPPQPQGLSAHGAATAPPPLKLQMDQSLGSIGPYSPPPPLAPRIPGKDADAPRPAAPSDWR